MKKAFKSFLSRFLVCFKNRKVSSSLIRPEIEEEEPALELKAVVCEDDPAAGLHVGEEIKAAGLNSGKEINLAGRREDPAAGIEAGEESAAGIEAGEESVAGIEADGIDPEEGAVTWNEASEEDPATGIDVGEEIKATGINVGEEIKVGGWREEPAEGIQEPAVGIQAEEEPAAGIKASEEETAGDKETSARFDAEDDEPTAGTQAGQGESAAGIEAEVETLTGIDADDEESTVRINAEEELATGIEAGKEELAVATEEPLMGIEADRGHQSGGGCGDDRWSSSLHSGFLPYGSDDVGCSSYSSYSGYSREGRYFRGKTRVCHRV